MCLTGSLTDFSLADILLFIEKGNKSGLLTLFGESASQTTSLPIHYIWVYRGRIVLATKRLENGGLIKLINQHQWVSPRVVTKLAQLCPIDKPLGLYFKEQGVLQTSQLKQLFFIQVLQPVAALCQLQEGHLRFVQHVSLPLREMTGLSLPAGIPKLFAPPKDTKALHFEDWKSQPAVTPKFPQASQVNVLFQPQPVAK